MNGEERLDGRIDEEVGLLVHIEDVVCHVIFVCFFVYIAGFCFALLSCLVVFLTYSTCNCHLTGYLHGYKTHHAVLFDARLGPGPGYFGGRGAWTADDEACADGLSGW